MAERMLMLNMKYVVIIKMRSVMTGVSGCSRDEAAAG